MLELVMTKSKTKIKSLFLTKMKSKSNSRKTISRRKSTYASHRRLNLRRSRSRIKKSCCSKITSEEKNYVCMCMKLYDK